MTGSPWTENMMRTLVKTGFPYPLIWDSGQLDILTQGHTFAVEFRRLYNQEGQASGPPGVSAAQNVELRYDRQGRVSYTAIQILFPWLATDQSKILHWVHRVINRLLEVYRFTTEEFFVDAMPKNELWPRDVFTVNDAGGLSPDISHIQTFGYGITIARKANIPARARTLLSSGKELPIFEVLFLNARREELLENYRVAVMEVETAFEVLVDEAVARFYRGQGLKESEIRNKLEAGLMNLLKDHVPKSCGKPFLDTPEYTDWKQYLYDLRNAVVHDGASINAEEAKKAIEVGEKSLLWLAQRLPD